LSRDLAGAHGETPLTAKRTGRNVLVYTRQALSTPALKAGCFADGLKACAEMKTMAVL
jgi:hypothetical protein